MVDMLAQNARLNNPLSPDTDFSVEESKAVQDQVTSKARRYDAQLLTHEAG